MYNSWQNTWWKKQQISIKEWRKKHKKTQSKELVSRPQLELKKCLHSKNECVNQVRPQLELKKIAAYEIYMFAHGHSPDHMANHFKVGASTIKKYICIVCDILTHRKKLFSHCISILMGNQLQSIIKEFEELSGLSNICRVIDDIHIPLVEHPSKRVTLATSDFYNKKKFSIFIIIYSLKFKTWIFYILFEIKGKGKGGLY